MWMWFSNYWKVWRFFSFTFRCGVFCSVFFTIQYYCIFFVRDTFFLHISKLIKKKPTKDSSVIAWNKTQGERLCNNFWNIFNIDIQYIIHARKLNYCQDDNKKESQEKEEKFERIMEKVDEKISGQRFRVRGES